RAPAPDRGGVDPVPVPVADEHLVGRPSVDEDVVRRAAGQGVLQVVGAPAPDAERVLAVAVPVTDDDIVTSPPVDDDAVGVPAGQAVLDVVDVAAPDGGGVLAVAVPVAHEDGVVRPAVGDDVGRWAAGLGVGEVIDVAAPHGEGVLAGAVPVADVDAVVRPAVLERPVGAAGPGVVEGVLGARATDLITLGGGTGRGEEGYGGDRAGEQRSHECPSQGVLLWNLVGWRAVRPRAG